MPSESTSHAPFLEKLQKEDAEAQVTVLNTLGKKVTDLGGDCDILVYHDGKTWRVCIDNTELGDLQNAINLGEYCKTHEHTYLNSAFMKDCYTISVNVYKDGDLLEIVGLGSTHGTHVAAISAAYFPDEPDRCGVAPGAKIVSIAISDNRLGGMETSNSISRAMDWVMHNPHYKVDLINMSYGEHASTITTGKLGDFAYEVVNDKGIIWFASASNHGPGLSTVGCPPDFYYDCVIGVGAYISNNMKKHMHSLLGDSPDSTYTWSSRGPTKDGGYGVSVCAPGGAIASMPAYTFRHDHLLNGTSMASPNATGCAALLLSALKKQGYLYNPYTVRRAIENTALKIDGLDQFSQGHGLVQVERAWEFLQEFGVRSENPKDFTLLPAEDTMRYIVECDHKGGHKGIYLRNWDGKKSSFTNVTITPFQFNENVSDDKQKIKLSLDLVLNTDSPCSWVTFPNVLHMSYSARGIAVRVDPEELTPGKVYCTTIKAYIAKNERKGPLFYIPVTVCMPDRNLENGYLYRSGLLHFPVSSVLRRFVQVPVGATHCVLTYKISNTDIAQKIVAHCIQLFPHRTVYYSDFNKNLVAVQPNEPGSVTFVVRQDVPIEICFARWWSAVGDISFEYELSFHGILPTPSTFNVNTSCNIVRTDIVTRLRSEELSFSGSLNRLIIALNPYDSNVEVVTKIKNVQSGNHRLYELTTSYVFLVNKATDVSITCPMIGEYLYESEFESQMWILYDSKKHHIGAGDAYSCKHFYKLDKGEYVIKFHLRYEKSEVLEKMHDLPVTVTYKFNDIPLQAYYSYEDAVVGGRKCHNTITTLAGEILPLFISAPILSEHRNLKHLCVSPGHVLTGTVCFCKDEAPRKVLQYRISLFVTEQFSCKKKNPSYLSEYEPKLKSIGDFNDAKKDLSVQWITRLDMKSSGEVYSKALKHHPSNIKLHQARLQSVDNHFLSKQPSITNSSEAEKAEFYLNHENSLEPIAKELKDLIDVTAILAASGTRTDTRKDASKQKALMEQNKNALIDAHCREWLARLKKFLPSKVDPTSKPALELYPPYGVYSITFPPEIPSEELLHELDNSATLLLKLVDPSDAKVAPFFVAYYQTRGLHSSAAKLLLKMMDERPSKDLYIQVISQVRLLGFHHLVREMCRSFTIKYPANFLSL